MYIFFYRLTQSVLIQNIKHYQE